MKHTDITLERLKNRYPSFFKASTFHKDVAYSVVKDNDRTLLRVAMQGGRIAYYEEKTPGGLIYTSLN